MRPAYRFTPAKILVRIEATRDTVVENARSLTRVRVAQNRITRTARRLPERAQRGTLPHLGFRDGAFDLALCSHFLFTYSGQLTLDFHVASIEEMCRVASEARMFPLLNGYGGRSPHFQPVLGAPRVRAYRVEIRGVLYEFQRGRDEMLAVAR